MSKHVASLMWRASNRLYERAPYLTHLFSIMGHNITKSVDTMAVDKCGRLYINQEFAESISVDQFCYCLLHEMLHIVANHVKRFDEVDGCTKHDLTVWNYAVDLSVQQKLATEYGESEPDGIITIDGTIPGTNTKWLDVPGLGRNMTCEKYYELIHPLCPIGGGDGGNRNQVLDPAKSGSNSGGCSQPYELTSDGTQQSMVESHVSMVDRDMERQIVMEGTLAGEVKKELDCRLRPQPDPYPILTRTCARSVRSPLGQPLSTYRIMNRRQQPGQARRRGFDYIGPECSIIIDTSGSMQGLESRAFTAIAQGLKSVSSPRVIAFDTEIQSAKRMTCAKNFEFVGYGGTAMDKAIIMEDEEHRPDAMVVVTDGMTAWPAKPTRARLVVVLVGRLRSRPVPSWAKVVDCREEVINV